MHFQVHWRHNRFWDKQKKLHLLSLPLFPQAQQATSESSSGLVSGTVCSLDARRRKNLQKEMDDQLAAAGGDREVTTTANMESSSSSAASADDQVLKLWFEIWLYCSVPEKLTVMKFLGLGVLLKRRLSLHCRKRYFWQRKKNLEMYTQVPL